MRPYTAADIAAAEARGYRCGFGDGRRDALESTRCALRSMRTDPPRDTLSPIRVSLHAPGQTDRERAQLAFTIALAGIASELLSRVASARFDRRYSDASPETAPNAATAPTKEGHYDARR